MLKEKKVNFFRGELDSTGYTQGNDTIKWASYNGVHLLSGLNFKRTHS